MRFDGKVAIVTGAGQGIAAESCAAGRLGQPDDQVGTCLFLLSDEARWLTGQVIAVDGGQSVRI